MQSEQYGGQQAPQPVYAYSSLYQQEAAQLGAYARRLHAYGVNADLLGLAAQSPNIGGELRSAAVHAANVVTDDIQRSPGDVDVLLEAANLAASLGRLLASDDVLARKN